MKGIIIGFGNMGRIHLGCYQKFNAKAVAVRTLFGGYKKNDTEITAVIDADVTARKAASELGIETYAKLADYIAAHGTECIDFVDICLPTFLHLTTIKEVTRHFTKKPVAICVEKPVVLTNDEANELEVIAASYGATIFVAECEHYNKRVMDFLSQFKNPAAIHMIRLVNLNYFIKDTQPWFLDAKQSGGIILDMMIHDFSLLDHFYHDAKLVSVSGNSKKFGCYDEAVVRLKYEKVEATVTGSWLSTDEVHPIKLNIKVTDSDGLIHELLIDDYLIEQSDEHNSYLQELKVFLAAIQNSTMEMPHQLNEYTRSVRLATEIIERLENRNLMNFTQFSKGHCEKLRNETSHHDDPEMLHRCAPRHDE